MNLVDNIGVTSLTGFAFNGYRSFSSSVDARLAPLRKINLVVGENNVGKSNILRVLGGTYSSAPSPSSDWDRPLVDGTRPYRRFELHLLADILKWSTIQRVSMQLGTFFDHNGVIDQSPNGPGVWLPISERGAVDEVGLNELAARLANSYNAHQLSVELTGQGGGGSGQDALRVLRAVFAGRPAAPESFTVAGVRLISDASDENPDLNGLSIKRRLLELQNPTTSRLADRDRFDEIQRFVRSVLEDDSISINIPYDVSTIHISQGGQTLPIENVGTGIHEVVILAAAATVTQDSILCIEEPEVHLHPVLQRKLLRYLNENTSNQYFIATHSAHMLDSAIGSIFHVRRSDGVSTVSFAGAARDRAAICSELGYRPSDLVQTNAVLWVEGPSDRIYLRWWIEQLAPGEFVEGTHFSIMFYGGALLNSLSPLDAEEVGEFISLKNLNRFMVVLMDSDMRSQEGELNEHKRRVIEGLAEEGSEGFAWVTAGYTIENYIGKERLDKAIGVAHASTAGVELAPFGRWDNPLSADRLRLKQPSKVAIARSVVSSDADEWFWDLREKMEEVLSLIRRANKHT